MEVDSLLATYYKLTTEFDGEILFFSEIGQHFANLRASVCGTFLDCHRPVALFFSRHPLHAGDSGVFLSCEVVYAIN